jgi:integrase
MGRPSTGTVFFEGGRWKVRLTFPDGRRPIFVLPEWFTEEQAKAKALELATAIRTHGVDAIGSVEIPKGETVAEYADRWLAWRKTRGVASVKDDRARLERHVLPLIGHREIRMVTRAHLEDVRDALDTKVRTGFYFDRGRLGQSRRRAFSWKTATLVWANVTRLFADTMGAKPRALRVRTDNPCDGIAPTDGGVRKAKGYLYPAELAALVCSERVPLRWRRLFAIAVYTYTRAGELQALSWEDVDLTHATLHVHQSIDRIREPGLVKSTKGKAARRVPIEPALLPLLKAMKAEGDGTGRVLDMPSPGVLSAKLRAYLHDVGVTRADLFQDDATRKAITFHDLRATGITWCACRGDDPLRIKQRAGHAAFTTTEGYIRDAENLSASFGSVFPVLPASLGGSGVGVTGFEPVASTV